MGANFSMPMILSVPWLMFWILFFLWLVFNPLERAISYLILRMKENSILTSKVLFLIMILRHRFKSHKESGSLMIILKLQILNKMTETCFRCQLYFAQRNFSLKRMLILSMSRMINCIERDCFQSNIDHNWKSGFDCLSN